MLRNILLGAGVFSALIAVLIFSGKLSLGNKTAKAQGEVIMWGTVPEEAISRIFQEFNPKAKSYRITYKEVPAAGFNRALVESLASGTGPDLILAPHQYILSNAERIYPFPPAYMSETKFKEAYVDGASVFLTPQGALALPVAIDPMVLFYNRYLLSKHGVVTPPSYWDDLMRLAPTLTVKGKNGQFLESAIAVGAPNAPYMKDLMMAVVGQLGQVPVLGSRVTANVPIQENQDIQPLATALLFFSGFADPRKDTYTWSQYSSRADDQFIAEKVAMYVGYASELPTLRSRNPKAEFEMTYLPQTKDYNTFTTGATFYGVAALKSSRNLVTALTAEADLGSRGVGPALAAVIGATAPFRSFASSQGTPDVIARSMLVARAWYDSFPSESSAYAATMMTDVLSGRVNPSEAASAFVSRLQDLYTPI